MAVCMVTCAQFSESMLVMVVLGFYSQHWGDRDRLISSLSEAAISRPARDPVSTKGKNRHMAPGLNLRLTSGLSTDAYIFASTCAHEQLTCFIATDFIQLTPVFLIMLLYSFWEKYFTLTHCDNYFKHKMSCFKILIKKFIYACLCMYTTSVQMATETVQKRKLES